MAKKHKAIRDYYCRLCGEKLVVYKIKGYDVETGLPDPVEYWCPHRRPFGLAFRIIDLYHTKIEVNHAGGVYLPI